MNIIQPGDILSGEITKSEGDRDVGLKIVERNGKLWVVGVKQNGLFRNFFRIKPGDQILKVNGQHTVNAASYADEGLGLSDVSRIFREENHIELELRRAVQGEYGDYTPFIAPYWRRL